MNKSKGFSLIELLVVIAIIGLLAAFATIALSGARKQANDTKRKSDLSRIGQMLYASTCYLPNAGAGDYDLKEIVAELSAQNPQYAQYAAYLPKDPKSGSDTATNYRYQVTTDGHCVIYANLESENEPITLSAITAPTPNTGSGVLKASAPGPNGTDSYYQISK